MTPQNRNTTNRERLTVILMIASAALLYTGSLSPFGADEDDYHSFLLGHALATGQGYRPAGTPEPPVESIIPPGYPAAISPVLAAAGHPEQGILPVRLLSILFAVAFAATVWFLLAGWLEKMPAALLTFLIILNPYMLDSAGLITADTLHGLLSLLGLLLINRWLFTRPASSASPFMLVGVALICAAVYYVQIIGIALAAATITGLAGQRRYRRAGVVGACFLALAAPWNVWILLQGGDTYLDMLLLKNPDFAVLGNVDFLNGVGRLGGHLWRYAAYLIPGGLVPALTDRHVVTSFESAGLAPALALLRLGISGLIIMGLLLLIRRGPDLIHRYIICYVTALLIWPWTSWHFILPVLPLLWICLYQALREIKIWSAVASPFYHPFRAGGAVVLAVALIGSMTHGAETLIAAYAARQGVSPPLAAARQAAFEWLRNETEPESVLMCVDPAQFYVWSGRQGIRPPSVPTPEAVVGTLIYYDVDYVISIPSPGYRAGDLNALLVEPLVSSYTGIFKPVYRSPQHPDVVIYAVSLPASNRMAAADVHEPTP